MEDTIFALSSGAPPAAIATIRISGPRAGIVLDRLAGGLPEPRRASYRRLKSPGGETLDHALGLWFPGPATATGEDLAELHCHGGRAVVAVVEQTLAGIAGLRRATPGEFTRRAFTNGRIDLNEAEGLADLLSAETELQRRSAVAMAEGALTRQVSGWRDGVLGLSAMVEAALDFADEDDVGDLPSAFTVQLDALSDDIAEWLAMPRATALREGFKVVLAGPPNAGKSTLFNALVEDEAAITSPFEGTTRDVLARSVAIEGVPFQFFDTAGLRDETGDAIEKMGIDRARDAARGADVVLWLGPEGRGPEGCWEIEAKADEAKGSTKRRSRHRISAVTGEGLRSLRSDLVETARAALPRPGAVALSERQHTLLTQACEGAREAQVQDDLLLVAEGLRSARLAFDRLIGRSGTEDMLDTLFGRFCIGK